MASRIDPSPRRARYSGRLRPAWRMNHTGVCGPTWAVAAARKAEDVLVAMARPTLPVAPIELHDPFSEGSGTTRSGGSRPRTNDPRAPRTGRRAGLRRSRLRVPRAHPGVRLAAQG